MKFSYRQILASAGGAVLSAVIASVFGVKGTIVGVAIGSIAATMGTALVFQSIERTNKAVKQVVVRVPDSTKLLRRLGGTNAAGVTTRTESPSESAVTEETTTSAATEPAVSETSESQVPSASDASGPRAKLPWPVVVGTIVGVFVFSLLLVTVVELIAGRPLADLFGHSGGGTTVEKIFESPPTTLPPPTTTTTSTSTTTTSSSTSTTVAGSTTTSSTDLGSSSTTSTTVAPGSSTTTTGGVATSP